MKIKKIIKYIFLLISLLIFFLSVYIFVYFDNVSLEQLLYSLITSEGTNLDAIIYGLIFVTIGVFVSFFLLLILKKLIVKFLLKRKKQIYITLKYKTKEIIINLFKPSNKKETIFIVVFSLFLIVFSIKLLKIDKYIKSQFTSSNIFEEYYVDSRDVKIEFPKKKKNLIYIYVESLEMTNASAENGGALEKTYIPYLEKIALDEKNINFSNTSKLGGAFTLTGTEWTAAAMISQTSGVPLKLSIDPNCYYNFGGSLPGIYNLGDILEENGYNNYLFIGSDAEFGGRKDYFTYHGNYTIYDHKYAQNNGWIDEDYYVWWGYEDKKLFEFAKDTLLEIAEKEEPFNFTLLTADTHFFDGYFDNSCSEPFDKRYANVFNCSDGMLNNFILWLEDQDFYDDTVIVITGDHLTMQQGFYTEIDSEYTRNLYNAFINSKVDPINSKNRQFSSLDMYPTTLSALGVEIEGNRLGLGTNLFSDVPTLIEELGYDYFNEELKKKSFFYDNNLLGDTYYKMQEQ